MNFTKQIVKHIHTACGMLIICVAAVGCGNTEGSAKEKTAPSLILRSAAPSLTIGIPLAMIVNHLDSTHGIPINMQAFGTSSTVSIDAVLNKDATFAPVGTLTAMQAIRQGADLKIIASIVNNVQVMVIRDEVVRKLGLTSTSPIVDRVHALKGLTIATGSVGSTHYQILRSYLMQYGLDPDKDVRLIGMAEPSALVTGIEQGRFDAIAYASPLVEMAIARGVGQIWISGPRGDIPGSENIKTSVIVVRTETLQKNRLKIDSLRAALTDALRTVQNEHDVTGRKLHDQYFSGLVDSVWEKAWNATTTAYPANLMFTRQAFDYWIKNDPKGAESYSKVDYKQITYDQAQSQ
jgi:NitT/TauT family transport system substrate-binding protein